MDRKIEQKKGIRRAFTKKALPFWGGALLLVFILWLIFRDDSKKLRIDADNITVSTVTLGEFNDYIRISGQVAPMTTIQISPLEGGVVQQIVTEEGSRVKAGDVILILSNKNLDMQILSSEADLAEKENILRNTMIQMEQQKLSVEQEKLQLQMEVQRNRRTYEAQKSLYDDGLIAREDFLKAEEDFTLSNSRLKLVENRAKQDSLHRTVEIDRMREILENMRINMMMIRKRKENLTIKAPIDGELGLLDVVLGQPVGAGSKIGQINNLDSYKIEAQIDEHYIDRITPGLEERAVSGADPQGVSRGARRQVQGRLQVHGAAARQHPQRPDLLPQPATRPACGGGAHPAWRLLPENRRQVDLCPLFRRQQGHAPRHQDWATEPAVLRGRRRP